MKENQIVVYQPNETVRLEVELRDESIWLPPRSTLRRFGREEREHERNVVRFQR